MFNKSSRFTNGGTTDLGPKFLGWWERTNVSQEYDDVFIEIDATTDRRPDIIAKRYLGSETMQWLVLQYNAIIDLETELTVGTKIRLPSVKRALSIMAR